MKKVKEKVTRAKNKFIQLKPPVTVQLADYYNHLVRLFVLFTIASFAVLVTVLLLVSKSYQNSIEQSRGAVKEYYYWKEVAKTHPDFPDGLIQAARYSYAMGYTREALMYIEQALIQDPKSKKALELRDVIMEE